MSSNRLQLSAHQHGDRVSCLVHLFEYAVTMRLHLHSFETWVFILTLMSVCATKSHKLFHVASISGSYAPSIARCLAWSPAVSDCHIAANKARLCERYTSRHPFFPAKPSSDGHERCGSSSFPVQSTRSHYSTASSLALATWTRANCLQASRASVSK